MMEKLWKNEEHIRKILFGALDDGMGVERRPEEEKGHISFLFSTHFINLLLLIMDRFMIYILKTIKFQL